MQQTHTESVQHHNRPPTRALPRKYVEPILYLADRMVGMGQGGHKERGMFNLLTETAGMKDYARQTWFRELNDQRACQRLAEVDTAKRGTLIVLALLIKADPHAGDAHRNYFTKVRNLLGAEPITVPTDLEEHRRLALGYLRD